MKTIKDEIMSILHEGKILNMEKLSKKYKISFKKMDKILEDNDLDICNKCYDIYKISWGELTKRNTGLTYCSKCDKKYNK